MTHRTTSTASTGSGPGRGAAVPLLVALALVGTSAATSPASATPAASTSASVSGSGSARLTTHLGYLSRITGTSRGTTLTFDQALLLTGAAANAEQRRRGLDTTPDFHVGNDNRLLRTRTVAPGVTVVGSQELTGSPAPRRTTFSRLSSWLAARPNGRTGPLFRLTTDRRQRVVCIAEVYLP